MTKEQTAEAIKIMQAWLDGAKLQYKRSLDVTWIDAKQASDWDDIEFLAWNWADIDYRIKPSGSLRPWTADEVPLGAWIRVKGKEYRRIIVSTSDEYDRAKWLEAAEHSTDCGKTWLPCGVEEGGSL